MSGGFWIEMQKTKSLADDRTGDWEHAARQRSKGRFSDAIAPFAIKYQMDFSS
ncbi:hypothetical protein BH20ACI3_BH20ACI3_02070 [soil metagenome]